MPASLYGRLTGLSARRHSRLLAYGLLMVPVLVNAVALLPELSSGAPSLNDDAFHFLFLRGASDALARGANPLDSWLQIELGFPEFFYYQNLPHLLVLLLNRLSLGSLDLLTSFNLVRYVLLVAFPLTVFWSTRRMGFGITTAAIAGAASSLISGNVRYGFEYDSYIWRGLGMYTQLWAAHLSFIAVGCVVYLLRRGKGHVAAILAISALVLSHLIYAYMMAITLPVILILGSVLRIWRKPLLPSAALLALVGGTALVISAYMWLPFLLNTAYLSASPYLQAYKYDSFGAPAILGWLASGDLFDHGRLPVLTILLGAGIVAVVLRRHRRAVIVLAGFVLWLALYFGRPTLGGLVDLMPLHEGLLLHRFIGEMEMFAIILMGIGGAFVWRLIRRLLERPALATVQRWRQVIAFGAIGLMLVPALAERTDNYAVNSVWMSETRSAFDQDGDLQQIVSTLQARPGGRTYAGLRTNWGDAMRVGPHVRVGDILVFHGIAALWAPGPSLNADLVWHFHDGTQSQYDLFDVRHVIVPSNFTVPAFYELVQTTGKYSLYATPTSGAAQFVAISDRRSTTSQRELFDANLAWFQSPDPAAGRFIRWDFPKPSSAPLVPDGCPTGKTVFEIDQVDAIHLAVDCPTDATLALKVSYHPNWQVSVDGQPVQTFMVSPSYLAINVPAGLHSVDAAYVADQSKLPLAALGLLVAGLLVVCRRRIEGIARRRGAPHGSSGPGVSRGRFNIAALVTAGGAAVALVALADLGIRSGVMLDLRWDTFMYHLPFALVWSGLPVPYDMSDAMLPYFQGFPPLPELVQGLLWRLTGAINATGVVNFIAFGVFLVYCHKILRAPYWLVALISLTAPLVLIHTTVNYVDLFSSSFLAIGVASCLHVFLFPERSSRAVIVGGLAALGAAAWSKFLLMPIVGLMLVLFVLVVFRSQVVDMTRRQLVAVVLTAVVIAAVPYVKNLALYGNPFWPVKVPLVGDLFPYLTDPATTGASEQRPANLSGAPQAEVFLLSMFEVPNPTHYDNRPRWIIDQGNTDAAFRMGGFWWVGVVVFLSGSFVMLVATKRRRGIFASIAGVGILTLVAFLPQSNELRYYMFLPLSWAATIGMLYPALRVRFPRAAVGLGVLVLALFSYMVAENRGYYDIQVIGYHEAAVAWNAAAWWPYLEQGQTYCVVDMAPIGVLMTGPTMSEYGIIDRSSVALCPAGTIVVTYAGIQGPVQP